LSGAGSIGSGFTLDRFQVEAIEAIEAGLSVLVAAPTGSGKTVVAEHAVRRAADAGRKAFYTTPIKALSNQKFTDLVAEHGADRVGLLTGDNAVNGDAPIVVMTTEVLRNMIYAGSPALTGLGVVVLDEVHYLQDPYRGPVWEEVIIHLPREVALVCLSATVSNADELAAWIGEVRGPTATVVEERRPVELTNLYVAHDRANRQLFVVPTLAGGRPNPAGERLDADLPLKGRPQRGRPRRRFATPRRIEMVEYLAAEDQLPAIYFIFSRAGCDEAAMNLLDSGVRLTSPDERSQIRAIAEDRTATLSDGDLDVLGYDRWLAALELGIAAHHAGMVPPFKEAVEACFVKGLVKCVFATETLALGINMPARSVVIEQLSKFTGDHHELLTPAEYTQLTGRAGRRGIDTEGHAFVCWSPFVPFDQVAALALSRRFALTSSFRPTYNMTANLVRRYDPEDAHRLLNRSFAQFQSNRSVVSLEGRRENRAALLEQYRGAASCERGSVEEYRQLLRADEQARRGTTDRRAVDMALLKVRPGDVIMRDGERLAVLSVAHRGPNRMRVHAIGEKGRSVSIESRDFTEPPLRIGEVAMPEPFNPNNRSFQQEVVRQLRRLPAGRSGGAGRRRPRPEPKAPQHPVAGCPDRAAHVRASVQVERIERELADLDRRIGSSAGSVARRFDAVLGLLEGWGFVRDWALTDRGELLVRTYHESDLLLAEAVARGLFDDLDPPAVAALASCVTYEHRSRIPAPPPWFPSADVRGRFERLERIGRDLQAAERAADLPETRLPDPTFAALAHAWASGTDLATVLDDEDLSGGDFVRNVRQLIDLLRQLAGSAPERATRVAADLAADALFRGVVAASSLIGSGVDDDEPIGPDDAPES
jgi:ATP-dependent RNA helicase HelY